MRFSPAALALASTLALTSSVALSQSAMPEPNAYSAALQSEGRTFEQEGKLEKAIDLYESAIAYDPSNASAYLSLANIAEAQGLYGKALRLNRRALDIAPDNIQLLAAEARAYVGKGALRRAKGNLSRIELLCGMPCPEADNLAALIERGPPKEFVSADAVTPETTVEQEN